MAADPKVKKVEKPEVREVNPVSPPPEPNKVVGVDIGKKSPDGVAMV